jgi:hypothetical protein
VDRDVEPARIRVKQTQSIRKQLDKHSLRSPPQTFDQKKVLPREEVRADLIALPEKIENECPGADPSRGLLTQSMLEE